MNVQVTVGVDDDDGVSDEALVAGYLLLVEVLERSEECRRAFGGESKVWRMQLRRLRSIGREARKGFRLRRGVRPDGVEFVEVGDESGPW